MSVRSPVRSIVDFTATQTALSLFRIGLFGVVLGELTELYLGRAASVQHPIASFLILPVGIVGCVACMAGAYLRVTSILTFMSVKALQPFLVNWYEVDWVMELFTLLYCFAPSSHRWSIDAMRRRSRGLPCDQSVEPAFVLAVAVALTLLYADAVHTKVNSEIWRRGLAVWLASFVPHVTWVRLPAWLQNERLLWIATHVTTAYEALFLLVLTRLRRFVVPIGLALHLSIALLLPLKYFGLIMVAPLLLFTDLNKVTQAYPSVPSSRRRLGRWLTGAYCAALVLSWGHMKLSGYRAPLTALLGVHPTGVYADSKFLIVAPIYRLELAQNGTEAALPSFDEQGYPTIRDRAWKSFGFFTRFKPCPLDRVIRYVESHSERCVSASCEVRVYAKDVRLPGFAFDPALPAALARRPWTYVGSLHWYRVDGGLQSKWLDPKEGRGLMIRTRYLKLCDSVVGDQRHVGAGGAQ